MSMCPTIGTGKMLSQMDLIVKMRNHLTEKGAAVTSKTPWLLAFAFNNSRGNQLLVRWVLLTTAAKESLNLLRE